MFGSSNSNSPVAINLGSGPSAPTVATVVNNTVNGFGNTGIHGAVSASGGLLTGGANVGPFAAASGVGVVDHNFEQASASAVNIGALHATQANASSIGASGLYESKSSSANFGTVIGVGHAQAVGLNSSGLSGTEVRSGELFGHTSVVTDNASIGCCSFKCSEVWKCDGKTLMNCSCGSASCCNCMMGCLGGVKQFIVSDLPGAICCIGRGVLDCCRIIPWASVCDALKDIDKCIPKK